MIVVRAVDLCTDTFCAECSKEIAEGVSLWFGSATHLMLCLPCAAVTAFQLRWAGSAKAGEQAVTE